MATSTVLSHARRLSRHLSSLSSRHFTNTTFPPPPPHLSLSPHHRPQYPPPPNFNPRAAFRLSCSHTFSTPSYGETEAEAQANDLSSGYNSGSESLAEELLNSGSGEESILPVRVLISVLDGYHDVTNWPWWVIIASSTLALRVVTLPIIILQIRRTIRIAQLFPKLPPPLPLHLSGRSFMNQISLFQKERRTIGCPSFLWFIASISVQVPCFLLLMTCIRRMSLDNHPGFDDGGTLWFQNLTEIPHGVLGLTFPFLIAGMHLINVKISFLGTSVGKDTSLLSSLTKCYRVYLYLMTLPIFFTGFCIPQGSLVYWLTNSSLTMTQQLSLKHPAVQDKLGLQVKKVSVVGADTEKLDTPGKELLDLPIQPPNVSTSNLSPKELLCVSIKYLSDGRKDKAIPLIRLALEKDPDYVRALIVMGQILLQKELPAEAIEYLERAISKLDHVGHLKEVEDCDLLILASQWAGVSYIRQNKQQEGIVHLLRIADMEEPEDSKSKAHFFDGLLLLSSALYNEGRKDEAIKHLRRAATYNPAYNEYLEQIENEQEDFVNDLVSSRRGDY